MSHLLVKHLVACSQPLCSTKVYDKPGCYTKAKTQDECFPALFLLSPELIIATIALFSQLAFDRFCCLFFLVLRLPI